MPEPVDTWSQEYKMQCLARHYLSIKPLRVRQDAMHSYWLKQKQLNGEARANAALEELKKYMGEEHERNTSKDT